MSLQNSPHDKVLEDELVVLFLGGFFPPHTDNVKVTWQLLQLSLVEEDLKCFTVHYFRHERSSK